MAEALKTAVRDDGYGGKGKSRWVREALIQLRAEDPQLAFVGLGEALIEMTELDSVTLDNTAVEALEAMMRQLHSESVRVVGAQSQVIRAAIRYRLSTRLS
ncbi:MAG: hypothetical protein ACPGUC_02415 [Gammaproteobacteria bacterium]